MADEINWGGVVPWATPVDLARTNGSTIQTTERTLTSEGLESGSALAPAESILVSSRAPIGYTSRNLVPMAFNQGCKAAIPSAAIDAHFLHFALIASTELMKAAGSGSTFLELSTEAFASLHVPIPKLEEQRRIADFLDDRVARIDQIITARRSQIATLAELSHRRLVDELLGAGESPLGKAPWFSEGLRTVRLSTVWTVIDCKHRTPTYQDTGFPVISPGDVSPGRLDLSRATRFVNQADYDDLADDLRRCRRGDLVYSRNASAGTAAYVDGVEPFTMGQDVCRITSHDANQLYLAYCLNVLTEPQLDSVRVGSTFTRINVDQIKMLTIPMRQLRDQITVAGACDRIADECRRHEVALERANQLLTEYKQSLVTAAVTGEIDVTAAGGGIPG